MDSYLELISGEERRGGQAQQAADAPEGEGQEEAASMETDWNGLVSQQAF